MSFTTATYFLFKLLATWVFVQWLLGVIEPDWPSVKPIVTFMRAANSYATTAATTICALLVLLPSFVFVVLEVFGHVRLRTRSLPSKSLSEYVSRGVQVINELEALGERLRDATSALSVENVKMETSIQLTEPVYVPDSVRLPQACGSVLMAVCRHSESLERLYSALQGSELEELIYCDCEEFEVRGRKVVAMIGMLRECMERQTEVVQAVDALCPILPPMLVTEPVNGVEDSGFIEN